MAQQRKTTELAERVEQKQEARAAGVQKTMDEWIVQYSDDFLSAMPGDERDRMKEQFVRLALNELRWQPDLRDCDHFSVIGALMTCAQLALQPSGPLNHVYMIPRNQNLGDRENPHWVKRVQLIVGYQGYRELAMRTGAVRNLVPDLVYEADEFEYGREGATPILRHRPPKLGTKRGEIIGAYCVAEMVDGSMFPPRVVDMDEILKAKAKSDAGRRDKGPWSTDFEAMCLKTAVRRLWKNLPQTPQAAVGYSIDGAIIKAIPPAPLEELARPQLDEVADLEHEQATDSPETDEDAPESTQPDSGAATQGGDAGATDADKDDPERPFTDDEPPKENP